MSIALLILLLAQPAGYDDIRREAHRRFVDTSSGRNLQDRLNDEYTHLAKACLLDDSRWEAYYERGANRAKRAFFARAEAENHIAFRRARGASPRELAQVVEGARLFLESCIADSHENYAKAFVRMQRRGEVDPDRRLLAEATLKFAAREYLKAQQGKPGAIDDLKRLLKRKFDPAFCKDHIALSYLDLGYLAFSQEKFPEAQKHWDEALKWSESRWLRNMVLTNKAGAFEMDNEFGRAEEVLRAQIERDPYRAVHWKNLGLVVGYQNRLKEALHCYAQARDLCRRTKSAEFFGKWHGNAWLRAAVIHGKLLESDGDLPTAWRLFLEYRGMFGDDYNFSVAFADFATSLGRYDLAWTYYAHAAGLQPHCVVPYLALVEIAPRLSGTSAEVDQRIDAAEARLEKVRARYKLRAESPAVKRICAGMRDLADGGPAPATGTALRIDPDPIAGAKPDVLPDWVQQAAAQRDPFVAWTPPAGQQTPTARPVPEAEPAKPRISLAVILAGVTFLVVVALFVFGRRGS